jgi:hypothetical protein
MQPIEGVKLETVGGRMTVKLPALDALHIGVVVMLIVPLVAPTGTVAVTCVGESTVNEAVRPLKRTAVVPPRFVPVMTTLVPTGALVGAKSSTVGVLHA